MKRIRRALRSDSEAINRLRITEFQRSGEFTLLQPERLLWNACDDEHVVLAAWEKPNLPVSTMRAVVVKNPSEALASLECTLPDEIVYPAVIFNSAATHRDYRKSGLNQAIRYHYLMAAQAGDIRTVISPVYENAPRTGFMQILGYRFILPKKTWQTKLAPHSRKILGLLQRAQFQQAIDILEKMKAAVITEYPYQGDRFVLASDRSVDCCPTAA